MLTRIVHGLSPIIVLAFGYGWMATLSDVVPEMDGVPMEMAATIMIVSLILLIIGAKNMDDSPDAWYTRLGLVISLPMMMFVTFILAPVYMLFALAHGMTPALLLAGGAWLIPLAYFGYMAFAAIFD